MTTTLQTYDITTEDYDLYCYQGETWERYSFIVTDDNDSPVNLTGYTARMDIRDRPGGTLHKSLTSTSGITITAATGEIAPVISASDTAAFYFNDGVYDLWIKDSSNNYTYLIRGKFIVRSRISETA